MEYKKIKFSLSSEQDRELEYAENLKKKVEMLRLGTEKVLLKIEEATKKIEEKILEQENEIKKIKLLEGNNIEGYEVKLQEAINVLKVFKENEKEMLSLKKKTIEQFNSTYLVDAEISAVKENMERLISEFKEEFLRISKERNN